MGMLKIGEIAEQSGVSIDTVRFYEREGLLGRVRRTTSNQRRYDPDTVRRLAFVRRASALGFSLAEIKGLLALRVTSRLSCERVRERALAKLADIDRRIAELTEMRAALSHLVVECRSGSADCAFLGQA